MIVQMQALYILNNSKNIGSAILAYRELFENNMWHYLLSGGGIDKVTLKTDSSLIRNHALKLIFMRNI